MMHHERTWAWYVAEHGCVGRMFTSIIVGWLHCVTLGVTRDIDETQRVEAS